MKLLQGTEERRIAPEKGELTSDNEEKIILIELENQIKKLAEKKVAGEDEVKNEAWHG